MGLKAHLADGFRPILDLAYLEDRDASVDFNFVMTEDLEFVELQGSGEEAVFTEDQMLTMLQLGKKGAAEICAIQRETLNSFDPSSDAELLDRIKKGRR